MSGDKKPMALTEENFKSAVLDSTKPVLVDFWADWCGPCHAVAPAIEEIARDFEGLAVIGKVDIEAQIGLADQYGIRSIPSFLLFRNGEVIERVIGVVTKELLAGKLTNLLEAA